MLLDSASSASCLPYRIKEVTMSKHISAIRRFSALALFAILAFAVSSTMSQAPTTTAATTPAMTPVETTPVQTQPATPGPISHNFHLNKINGTLNVTVNSDGTWDFSGTGKALPHKEYDVSVALKNKAGEMILFQYIGDATHGIQFSKQGQDTILKDNFASFAAGHKFACSYRFSEDKEGRALAYEARMKKLEALRREEEEARKRHDEKVAAEKKAAREKQQQIDAEREQQQLAQQKSSGGGGGSSVGSVLGAIGGVAAGILSFL